MKAISTSEKKKRGARRRAFSGWGGVALWGMVGFWGRGEISIVVYIFQ